MTVHDDQVQALIRDVADKEDWAMSRALEAAQCGFSRSAGALRDVADTLEQIGQYLRELL